jgi:Uma2 family endonuclease
MVTKQRITLEEYLALPEEKPYLEYVCGEVVQKMAAQRSHAALVAEFLAALRDYQRSGMGGFSGPETSILFDDPNDQRVLIPDAAYWAPAKPVGGELMSAPTLAIEVRSPGQGLNSLRAKCRYYRAHDVDVCWLVDPAARTVEVYEEGREGETLGPGATLTSPALPGFSLPLASLFAALEQ